SAAAAALLGGLLAGCQTLAPRDAATGTDAARLISPLAAAVIGDPAALEPLPLEPAARLPVPDIVLDEVPEPPPADVLLRLRADFSLPDSEDEVLRRELEWFSKHQDYLERVLNRASPYLHYIAEELAARGMPGVLALLPFVESAFDPFAYSRGRAAGL